ncbi:hypothetical protein V6N13_134207 [Hibiscus sabdariffa]
MPPTNCHLPPSIFSTAVGCKFCSNHADDHNCGVKKKKREIIASFREIHKISVKWKKTAFYWIELEAKCRVGNANFYLKPPKITTFIWKTCHNYVGHQDLDIQLKWKVSLLGTFVKKDFLLVNRWTFNRISDNPGGIWSHVETAFLEFKNCSPPTTPSPSSRYLGTPRFNINSEVALPLIRIQACPALLRWFDGIIVAGL